LKPENFSVVESSGFATTERQSPCKSVGAHGMIFT